MSALIPFLVLTLVVLLLVGLAIRAITYKPKAVATVPAHPYRRQRTVPVKVERRRAPPVRVGLAP